MTTPLATEKLQQTPEIVARRSFLGLLSGLIATGISAVLGITIGRYSIIPALSKSGEAGWLDVGPLAKIPEDQLVKRSLTIAQDAGWGQFKAQRLVWISRKGETLTVFSATCPHLGCTVNVKDDCFACACHNSKWEATGQKIAGPTPRNLDTLEHRIEKDNLQVKYQDFKQGIAAKELV